MDTNNIYKTSYEPSAKPPKNLDSSLIPQFVLFGFDDNGFSGLENSGSIGGFKFIIDLFNSKYNPSGNGNLKTFDGQVINFTFFALARYAETDVNESKENIKKIWNIAIENGNEIGLHTYSHLWGDKSDLATWNSEHGKSIKILEETIKSSANLKKSSSNIYGFRVPYMIYNNELFLSLKENKLLYDCSIEEGFRNDQDGTNYFWPYTLDYESPGAKNDSENRNKKIITTHKGLWEIPLYAFIIPPDELCEKYNVKPGFRERMKKNHELLDVNINDGKIVGMDWIMWDDLKMSNDEFLAVLKYSFDLRITGNRCPFTFCLHSDIYTNKYQSQNKYVSFIEKQEALTEFIDYILCKPETRIIKTIDLIKWMLNPETL